MSIDIFSIPPSVISRDLSGKSFLFYGTKKSGKTTNAAKFPDPLLMGFERGWNMLSGVKAQPINKWREALEVKKQLLKDAEAVEKGEKKETYYKTVIVDTADIAYNLCEDFILQKEGAEYLSETQNMRGYKSVEKEFDKFFQEICKAGYTLVAISHSDTVQIKENGVKYDRTQPTIDKRGLKVLARLVDIIGFATNELDDMGNNHMVLYMRGNKCLEAGSRNPYTSEKIPFTYEALLEDMKQAIDKQEAEGCAVDSKPITVFEDQTPEVNYEDTVAKIKEIAVAFHEQGISNKYTKVVENVLGKGRGVRDCDESQADLLAMVLDDLNELIKAENIEINSAI